MGITARLSDDILVASNHAPSAPPVADTAIAEDLVAHISDRITRQLPSFLSPVNMVFEQSAQLAFCLQELINRFGGGPPRKTFFCNARMEAVHGAIKLARHYTRLQQRPGNGEVLFFDAAGFYEPYFNPLGATSGEALIPGVHITGQLQELTSRLNSQQYRIIVLSLPDLPDSAYQSLCDYCDENSIVKILDITTMPLRQEEDYRRSLINRFDIVCWGEAFVHHQMPFAAFTALKEVYAPWNTLANCGLHSTTFGGNGMVLSYALRNVMIKYPVFLSRADYSATLAWQSGSASWQMERSGKYLNTYLPVFMDVSPKLWTIERATGAWLYVRKDKHTLQQKFDGSGNSGCNVLGHNAPEIVGEVIQRHNTQVDYRQMLQQDLQAATGLPHLFQGVSGASAVEIGLILAMLAQGAPKKILLFQGNFGGKTLAALSTTTGNHQLFKPLYDRVQVIDPFAANAAAALQQALTSGEIGLVWMEMIPGKTLRPLPQPLIDLVLTHRHEQQYLVGIDEVLNGLYRCGSFTSADLALLKPDFITFAKAFSGMVMPFSVLLCTSEVYKKAMDRNRSLVQQLEQLYHRPLSCHIAHYIFNKIKHDNIPAHVQHMSTYLKEGIRRETSGSTWLEGVEQYGLHIRFRVNMRMFPFRIWGFERTQLILTQLFFDKADCLLFFGRLLPPLNLSQQEADHLLKGIKAVFATSTWELYWKGWRQKVKRRRQVWLARRRQGG